MDKTQQKLEAGDRSGASPQARGREPRHPHDMTRAVNLKSSFRRSGIGFGFSQPAALGRWGALGEYQPGPGFS